MRACMCTSIVAIVKYTPTHTQTHTHTHTHTYVQGDILDINEIFRDLGTMVYDQGEVIGKNAYREICSIYRV